LGEGRGNAFIRYVDDCVVLCKGNTKRLLRGIRIVLGDLELNLSEEKTKIVDTRNESFNSPGFMIKVKKNPKNDKEFPLIMPSKKAIRHIKAEIKNLTYKL
jgi:RNA-directed DNA polymerase